MNKSDLILTILGCFRYSLGRMTYMPSHIVRVIIENKTIFRDFDWELFIREIDEKEGNLGMDCDIETWNKLKEFAKEQLK